MSALEVVVGLFLVLFGVVAVILFILLCEFEFLMSTKRYTVPAIYICMYVGQHTHTHHRLGFGVEATAVSAGPVQRDVQ